MRCGAYNKGSLQNNPKNSINLPLGGWGGDKIRPKYNSEQDIEANVGRILPLSSAQNDLNTPK